MIKDTIFIPDSALETKAYAMLTGFESQYGKIYSPPIPIDKIIECYLDLWIDWDKIEDTEEEKILGFLNPSTKRICINECHRDLFEKHAGLESFTKAHEVGHWDLHITKESDVVQLPLIPSEVVQPYLCRQSTFDKREIQAEKYAAYLLMPHHLIIDAINNVDLTKWPTLYSLRGIFGVTITAFTKRLKGLDMIYIDDAGTIFHSEEEAKGTKKFI
jgi:Zn-dependent peptidase ImmA (M78 family)